jgi:hypothetical protein
MSLRSSRISLGLVIGALTGCATTPHFEQSPPTPVTITLPAADVAEQSALQSEIAALATLTPEELQARHAVAHGALPYDPREAVNLDAIQATTMTMSEDELAQFGRDGFLIRDSRRFPTFAYGYRQIYMEDQPVFISADSILEAVHRSYDAILGGVEQGALIPELSSLLASMRANIGRDPSLSVGLRADLDLYLSVAIALLDGSEPACVAGCSSSDAQHFVAMARAHEGQAGVTLFGDDRIEDFSQYEPRAHYVDSPQLGNYFRAMMWLGRVDQRLIETLPDGTQAFRRSQLEVAVGLRQLMGEAEMTRWQHIDGTITAFVGEHDSMTPPQIDALLTALGAEDVEDLSRLDDSVIAQAIIDGGFGAQRIASQIMIVGTAQDTLPLARSFAMFGQRYVIDSHVFSNVVFDRVQHGSVQRLMPSTLDVAYAALGNDAALPMLVPELTQYHYAPDLEAMHVLVEAHDAGYWHQDLYTGWLSALRTLSPRADAPDAGLPAVARTEPWSRRILQTQLASWAELRHDTVLYAKQSYTGGNACEFPDAYVEPYPAFFDAITAWAQHGREVTAGLEGASGAEGYFAELETITTMLGDMARAERSGTPFTDAQLAFVNDAVFIQTVCGSIPYATGWYSHLYYGASGAVEVDPTIVDVHTQPTDEVGNPVGRILTVGTGLPRAAIFTFETCTGPRAYVGLVSSYFERITENFERPTDQEWAAELASSGHPADPAFLGDLIVR